MTSEREGVPRVAGHLRPSAVTGVLALGLVVAAAGVVLVPANIHSIWMDVEFGGWTAAIANRLDGARLYEDGAHSPMPPLPFVLLHLVSGGTAVWRTESIAVLLAQGLTLVVVYLALHRRLPHPAALIATLASALSFLALTKVMFYDTLAQFFVALGGALLCGVCSGEEARPRRDRWWRPDRALVALAGAATAGCLLTKQSTAAGLFAGAILALLCFPRQLPRRERAARVGTFVAAGGLALGVGLLLLSPWASPSGFVRDVLLRGVEAKGGAPVLWRAARATVAGLVSAGFEAFLFSLAALLIVAGDRRREPAAAAEDAAPLERTRGLAVTCLLATILAAILLDRGGIALPVAQHDTALGVVMVLLALHWARPRATLLGPWGEACLILFVIWACACIGHQLSVWWFRWTYDNNPLIAVVLGVVAALALRVFAVQLPQRGHAIVAVLTVARGLCAAPTLGQRLGLARQAVVPWHEVAFLSGAALREASHPMRALVEEVRRLSAPDETALLLPNDPNVEAWLERPRPRLSSAIIFPDQYWDRFADDDFERLRAAPPRVIVLGPRKAWREFAHRWHRGTGAERLIDRVARELLPGRYRHHAEHPIGFRGKTDHLDIFVRADPAG